jgi:hypothetical protein
MVELHNNNCNATRHQLLASLDSTPSHVFDESNTQLFGPTSAQA